MTPKKAPKKRTEWPKQQLETHIRSESLKTDNVLFTDHAKARMRERKVTMQMAFEALRKGRIVLQPEMDMKTGDVKCRMEHYVAGHLVKIVVAVSDDDPDLIVVTAI